MHHIITFYRDSHVLGVEPWAHGLDAAKMHAKNFISIRNATRVEVVEDDANKTLVFTLSGKTHA